MYTDYAGITRFTSMLEAPDQVIRCLGFGHRWDVRPMIQRPGYGGYVLEIKLTCDCGRVRTDVLDPLGGALLSRNYSGGYGPAPGVGGRVADYRTEYLRRSGHRVSVVL